MKQLYILSAIMATSAAAYAGNCGDFNYSAASGTVNWDTLQWLNSSGESITGVPTLSDNVYIESTSATVSVLVNDGFTANANSLKIGFTNGKTNPASVRIYGTGFLNIGNTSDMGGAIETANAATGAVATPGWTSQSAIYFSSSDTVGISSRFTNASSLTVYIAEIGSDGKYAGTNWLINKNVNYKVTGWMNLGGSNGNTSGDYTAAITQTDGKLSVSRILFSSNTSNNTSARVNYNLDGGTFYTSSVHLGNTQDSAQTDRTVNILANFNMLSGEIAHYSTTEMTFRDTFGHDTVKTTGAVNNGMFNINFGDKTAAYSGYAGNHSAMVLNTGTNVIRFEDTVNLKNYENAKGGFTVRGAGKVYNYANADITGKISILDTASLIIGGTDTYSIGSVNVSMAGKMFEKASEIFVGKTATYDFSKATSQQIYAGQTVSGSGTVLASATENLKVYGSLAPSADNSKAGTLIVSGNGTVEMSKNASLRFNLFSADGSTIDSNDKLSFATSTTFVEMVAGDGLGSLIFDVSEISADASFSILALFDNANADWSKFNFATTDSSRVAINFDGLDTINLSIIPEPSTLASLLGALALGFAVYRRRK